MAAKENKQAMLAITNRTVNVLYFIDSRSRRSGSNFSAVLNGFLKDTGVAKLGKWQPYGSYLIGLQLFETGHLRRPIWEDDLVSFLEPLQAVRMQRAAIEIGPRLALLAVSLVAANDTFQRNQGFQAKRSLDKSSGWGSIVCRSKPA